MTSHPWLIRLSTFSIMLALCVILLGAYTRLQDAGLGCPDWPGCYGQLIAPSHPTDIAQANAAFPMSPVDVGKAQTEMTHRYFAETLGLLIFTISILSLWKRQYSLPRWLPMTLMALVLFQGLLGMWTVTLQLWPIIVVLHLLGGFCTLGLLWLMFLFLRQPSLPGYTFPPMLFKLTGITLIIVFAQIFLGGWTSANYAALICADFPTCQGHWWPHSDFKGAFDFFATMETPARTAVHLAHRIGALFTFILVSLLVHYLIHLRKKIVSPAIRIILRRFARIITFLLLLQIALGISNVVFFLPLPIAVAHNGIAALLFLSLITLQFTLYRMTREKHG